MNRTKEMGDRLANIEGDSDNRSLEENEGRVVEGNITREDILMEQTEQLPEGEGYAGSQTLEENEAERFAESTEDTDDQTMEENKESLAESEGDTNHQRQDENQGMPAEGNITFEDFLEEQLGSSAEWMEPISDFFKKQLERLAVGKGDSSNKKLEENEGRPAEGNRTSHDLFKEQLEQFLGVAEHLEDRTSGNTADIMDTVREIDDPTVKDIQESVAWAETVSEELPGLPPEIRRMDTVSQTLFREALEAGKEKVYNIRLMIVGHLGVGKTTLAKRILGEKVEKGPHVSTEGIEVHPRCVRIDIATKEWIVEGIGQRFPDTSQHIVNIVTGHVLKSKTSTDGENQVIKNKNTDEGLKDSIQQKGAIKSSLEPNTLEMNMLLNRPEDDTRININRSNSDWLDFVTRCRDMTHSEKVFCYVTMLDFAGEFSFYSTHQAFMSWRTLYLLVTDMSKGLDDVVKDDKCSMNLNRNIERSIKDYALFWLNSIYSHGKTAKASPQREGRTQQETENDEQDHREEGKYPPVILVATHADKVPEELRKERKEKYFEGVRKILKERPLRFLLRGYFAFSNFGPETEIDELKQKIVELAEQQDYWGEEIPARWLALEQKLMDLKRNGEKIIE